MPFLFKTAGFNCKSYKASTVESRNKNKYLEKKIIKGPLKVFKKHYMSNQVANYRTAILVEYQLASIILTA